MSDSELTFDMDFSDGFVEGYLTGMMMGYSQSQSCELDDCPRK